MFRQHDELKAFVKKVDETNNNFRKEFGQDMAQISLTDLVPNLTQEDIMPDTDESVIMIDPTVNAKAGEARSFSLVQI